MNRTSSLAAILFLLAATAVAEAQYYRGSSYHPSYPSMPPGHMPGWDWWRTYPWSPYNYGRNPYNPIIPPYPMPAYPYPPVPPYVPPVPPADGAMFPNSLGPRVTVPQPTGPQSAPPPDAALVLVRVPTASASVRFDGERTFTEGTTRYFVTRSLQEGKAYQYTVSATFNRAGQPVTEERQVKVRRGHTTVVDFTRPAGK